jgi:hypothetical protein
MSWTDVVTALGTAGAALSAVGIAGWSHVQARKERDRSRRRDQRAEAYAVRVVQGERPKESSASSSQATEILVATVVNGGSFSITDVEVRFRLDEQTVVAPVETRRVSSFVNLPPELRTPSDTSREMAMQGVLAPWDTGVRAETGEIDIKRLNGHYAIVRWTDEWGQRWEHRLGKVRQLGDEDEWEP